MSEKNLPEQLKQDATGKQITAAPQSARRKLLKSTVAIPIIMTLHSGAALARSSNLTGAEINLENAAGDNDNVFCALPEEQIDGGAYDLGDQPSYTPISKYKDVDGTPTERTSEEIMGECSQQLPNGGIIISAGAFNSIGGRTGWTEL